MMLVLFALAVVTILGATLLTIVENDSTTASHGVWKEGAYQAAEGGIDDYVSKLVEDRLYYGHHTHPGESTRRTSGGTLVDADQTWTSGLTWTYPNGKDNWRQLSNGYEYNLQVTPPSAGTNSVTIVATGRKIGSTTDQRVLEVLIRPSSLADFYRVVNGDVAWGSGATTNGKIYANGDIDHDGIATADIYAEGQITGSVSMQNGAKKYDVDSNPTIRTKIKQPINFASFLTSLVDIQRASQAGGVYLNNTAPAAWKLTFLSNGTFQAQSCSQSGSNNVAAVTPVCGSAVTYNVPSNGAIYSEKTVIVSGTVKGRVTVASYDNIVIANNISYVTLGQDVLGLVAKNDVIIAQYTPNTMSWMASVLAQSGTWKTWSQDGSHNTMTFTGSSATNLGGSLTMFQTRIYGYAPELQYLSPPWFPNIGDAYTVTLFREVKPY